MLKKIVNITTDVLLSQDLFCTVFNENVLWNVMKCNTYSYMKILNEKISHLITN